MVVVTKAFKSALIYYITKWS